MRILITGAKGQLGMALQESFKAEELYLADLPELDLVSYGDTREYFLNSRPELVIHCAAMTNVDGCELDPQAAYLGNVIATKNVVNACQAVGADLVYISTDYVFDGEGSEPYREYDQCNPKSVYGKTKLQGESILKMHLERFYIIRTAWLFGDKGNNFVRAIIKKATSGERLEVVDDQIGSPTYASDLAEAIIKLVALKAYGIYHVTNEGSCTWFKFATEILTRAAIKDSRILPITSNDLDRPAPRPKFSILSKEMAKSLGVELPTYQDALGRFLNKLNNSNL